MAPAAAQPARKTQKQFKWEAKIGKTVAKEVWLVKKAERRQAKLKYCLTHGPDSWNVLRPDERVGVIGDFRREALEDGQLMPVRCVQAALG